MRNSFDIADCWLGQMKDGFFFNYTKRFVTTLLLLLQHSVGHLSVHQPHHNNSERGLEMVRIVAAAQLRQPRNIFQETLPRAVCVCVCTRVGMCV